MWEFLGFIGGAFISAVMVVAFIALLILPFGLKSSSVEARIYNEQHGTNYTTSDFFWGSSQINKQTQTIKIEQ
jgi:hypothetical protein